MVLMKFRCVSTTRRIKAGEAVLKAVTAKNEYTPDGCDENREFWEATPAGELNITYVSRDAVRAKVGAYYLIEIQQLPEKEEGAWKLWKVGRTETSMEVRMGLSWDNSREAIASAELYMEIHNKDAWKHFEGLQGTHWEVMFRQVDAIHPNCPMTDSY